MNTIEANVKSHSLYVYYHTHWDREWYLPFREYQHRLLKVVDDVIDTVEQGILPCFTLDGQTVLLEDYLEFRPENRERIAQLVQKDLISIGPWYVMPDEFLVSGESLIRNLQRGLRISRAFGERTFTGYLPDTFGHSADIPMLLNHFQIDTAILWRGVSPVDPLFYWQSPSGDTVLTYHLSEGYFQNVFHMGKDLPEKSDFIKGWLSRVSPLGSEEMPLLFPVGADHLGVVLDSPRLMSELAPEMKAVTPDIFMNRAHQIESSQLKTHYGELHDPEAAYILPGVFSSRIYLKQWNRRLEWRLTRQLEQLLCWETMLKLTPTFRPELDFLWKTLLLNHPHDSICGCSVDSVHRENESRFEQIDQLSQAMVRDAHHTLQQVLQPQGSLLVLNLSDVAYTGVVEIQQDYALSLPVPSPYANSQVISETEILDEAYLCNTSLLPLSENKAIRRKTLIWVEKVPPHGYLSLAQPQSAPDTVAIKTDGLANSLMQIIISPTGDLTMVDLQQNREFSGLHQLWRNDEQGDSYNAAPVPGTYPERAIFTGHHVVMSGPLRGIVRLAYEFPSIQLQVQTDVILDAGSPRVSFKTRFTNQTRDHKIQVSFRTFEPITEVLAEGHFSPVTRTYDPAYRISDHMPAPKLKELVVQSGAIQRFIGCQEQTLITEGLTEYEVEGNALKLTLLRSFGMLSRDDTGVRGSHAGPPLSTDEGQCLNRPFEGHYAWLPGFDAVRAFHQSDWFYGAVYGFDRQHEASTSIPSAGNSFFTWDNPQIQSTATVPEGEGVWHLRLLNPTPLPQSVMKQCPLANPEVFSINMDGRALDKVDSHHFTVPSYQIRTLQIQVE